MSSAGGASMSLSTPNGDGGSYGDGCGNYSSLSKNYNDNTMTSSTTSSTSRGGGKVWGIGRSLRSASIILKQQVIDISSIINDSTNDRDNNYYDDDDNSPGDDSYEQLSHVMDATYADVVKEANDLMTSVNKSTLAMGLEVPFRSVDEVRNICLPPLLAVDVDVVVVCFTFLSFTHILSSSSLQIPMIATIYYNYKDVSATKETSLKHWFSNGCTRISHRW